MRPLVQIVSHGPHCLDGTTAAAAVARYFADRADVQAQFASNSEIDAVLRTIAAPSGRPMELWITDISWRDAETDAYLTALAQRGVTIHWVDHHRTAILRDASGRIQVPFAEKVLSEEVAASRLVYEHLAQKLTAQSLHVPAFDNFAPVVAMADDNDRWLHRITGSRELAWVVRALGPDAFEDFLALDGSVTYTPRMRVARERVEAEIARSFAVAGASRTERRLDGVTLVTAVCDGHPSEIADVWGKATQNTVFALYDAKSLAISLRRSPDCTVDLSKVAEQLGGGGHAAAAGCEQPDLRATLAGLLADRVGAALP